MINKKVILKKVLGLTLAAGLPFWLTNNAISRTAIVADYSSAMSISHYPKLLESLIGDLITALDVAIGCKCKRQYGKA